MPPKPENSTGDRDYGKRLYVSDKPYQLQMRMRTDAHVDRSSRVPHSESKKPYIPDQDYPEMEYFRFDWDNPDWPDFPGVPDDPDINDDPEVDGFDGTRPKDQPPEFLGCDFWPPIFSPSLIHPEQMATANLVLGTEEKGILRIEVEGPVNLISNYSVIKGGIGKFSIIVKAWTAAQISGHPTYKNMTGDIPFQVTVRTKTYTPNGGPGGMATGVCTALGFVQPCPAPEELEWDYDESAQTIGQNDTQGVRVKGGLCPFYWSISGDGFSLLHTKTDGHTNWVITDPDACGPGTITVTDGCGESVEGSIRCTEGNWQDYTGDDFCPIPGAPDVGPFGADFSCRSGRFTKVQGKWQLSHCYQHSAPYLRCVSCAERGDCMSSCFDAGSSCHAVLGCSDCLTIVAWQYSIELPVGGMCNEIPTRCPDEGKEAITLQSQCYCLGDYGGNFTLQEWVC